MKLINMINLLIKTIVIFLVKCYQFIISPIFPCVCRYYPTCSSYTIEAVNKYGIIKGGAMAVKRILTCNSLFPGGYNPLK